MNPFGEQMIYLNSNFGCNPILTRMYFPGNIRNWLRKTLFMVVQKEYIYTPRKFPVAIHGRGFFLRGLPLFKFGENEGVFIMGGFCSLQISQGTNLCRENIDSIFRTGSKIFVGIPSNQICSLQFAPWWSKKSGFQTRGEVEEPV